jgi:hypothetical protein
VARNPDQYPPEYRNYGLNRMYIREVQEPERPHLNGRTFYRIWLRHSHFIRGQQVNLEDVYTALDAFVDWRDKQLGPRWTEDEIWKACSNAGYSDSVFVDVIKALKK